MDRKKALSISGTGILLGGLVAGVILAQQPQILTRRAAEPISNELNCNPGPNPYHSTSITVTNHTSETISKIEADVFRCPYVPNIINNNIGRFYCDPNCPEDGTCLKGTWDGAVSQPWRDIVLNPGESRTFTMTVNPCEIAQLDVRNDIHAANEYECTNVESQHTVGIGEEWPGGISFAIEENATGYNANTGTCLNPTNPPANTPTPAPNLPTPTRSPVVPTSMPTPTRQPTAPPGQPTYTPVPIATATPIPCLYQCIPQADCTGEGRQIVNGSCAHVGAGYVCCTPASMGGGIPNTPTPVPTRPVAGAMEISVVGIVGGIALLILAAL